MSFYSKKFNSFQLNYSVIEKETLALIWALQHFEVYVDSGSVPLVVYTDHNPTAFTALSKPQADAVGFISAVLLFGCSSH